jgi:hypothetical protein
MSAPDEPPASAYIADPRGEWLPLWALFGAAAWWVLKG